MYIQTTDASVKRSILNAAGSAIYNRYFQSSNSDQNENRAWRDPVETPLGVTPPRAAASQETDGNNETSQRGPQFSDFINLGVQLFSSVAKKGNNSQSNI